MKSKTIFIILFVVIIVFIPACSSEQTETPLTVGTAETENSETKVTSKEYVDDSLPNGLDFESGDINIMVRENIPFSYELGVTAANGELVNDAIYERNRNVEERLNVSINVYPVISGTGVNEVNKAVLSGDDFYSIFAGYAANMMEPVLKKSLYNLHRVEYLDFSKPWWINNLNEVMTVYDMLFFTAGDITLSMIQYEGCIFYNQVLYNNNNIGEDIYKLVTEGKWTLDKLAQLSKNVSKDLNGDGVLNKADLYGFSQADSVLIFAMGRGAGLKLTQKDAEGFPELVMDNEQTYVIIDKMNKLFTEASSYVVLYKKDEPSNSEEQNVQLTQKMFINDQVLFYTGHIIDMEAFRDMRSDYGIVPTPKYDEYQKNYITNSRDSYSMVAIPVTCADFDMTGAVMEAMASESYRTVTPAYFNIALKDKYSRDEKTSDMINIIHGSVAHDFGLSVIGYLNYISHTFQHCIENTANEFGSLYASRLNSAENGLLKLKNAYQELREEYGT